MVFSVCPPETPEVGGRGGTCPPPVLGHQVTLFGPRGADYAQLITTGPPRLLDDSASLSTHIYSIVFIFLVLELSGFIWYVPYNYSKPLWLTQKLLFKTWPKVSLLGIVALTFIPAELVSSFVLWSSIWKKKLLQEWLKVSKYLPFLFLN